MSASAALCLFGQLESSHQRERARLGDGGAARLRAPPRVPQGFAELTAAFTSASSHLFEENEGGAQQGHLLRQRVRIVCSHAEAGAGGRVSRGHAS